MNRRVSGTGLALALGMLLAEQNFKLAITRGTAGN